MVRYLRFGQLPSMHHIAHRPEGELLNEYCFTRDGFEEPYSILYLNHPPTGEVEAGAYIDAVWPEADKRKKTLLQRRHFKSGQFIADKNFISGRVLLAFNDDLSFGLCHPAAQEEAFFANNDADELFFLQEGEIEFQSLFGKIRVVAGDYLIVPRSCPYRFNFSGTPRLMFVEANHGIQIPPEYLNDKGQFKMDAPYSERSFKTPDWDDSLFENDDATTIIRKRDKTFTKTCYDRNYFKMSGWDGYVYPFAINLKNIQPKTGRVHLPPSSHLTFSGKGFAIMSFLPRVLDFDEQAVPCPFYHSSVNCDELLFYVSGDFTSRRGVEQGSISYHPSGIPHGPHPGAYEESIGKKRTEEQAIMVDTFAPLFLTEESKNFEDPNYPTSWMEKLS